MAAAIGVSGSAGRPTAVPGGAGQRRAPGARAPGCARPPHRRLADEVRGPVERIPGLRELVEALLSIDLGGLAQPVQPTSAPSWPSIPSGSSRSWRSSARRRSVHATRARSNAASRSSMGTRSPQYARSSAPAARWAGSPIAGLSGCTRPERRPGRRLTPASAMLGRPQEGNRAVDRVQLPERELLDSTGAAGRLAQHAEEANHASGVEADEGLPAGLGGRHSADYAGAVRG